jgi:hypothetical protein
MHADDEQHHGAIIATLSRQLEAAKLALSASNAETEAANATVHLAQREVRRQADEFEASQIILGELAAELGRLRSGGAAASSINPGDACAECGAGGTAGPVVGAGTDGAYTSDAAVDGAVRVDGDGGGEGDDAFPLWDDGEANTPLASLPTTPRTVAFVAGPNTADSSTREDELTAELQAVTATLRTMQAAQSSLLQHTENRHREAERQAAETAAANAAVSVAEAASARASSDLIALRYSAYVLRQHLYFWRQHLACGWHLDLPGSHCWFEANKCVL